MKTEVKKLDGSKVEISIEVVGDIVKNKFEDVFKKIATEAKIPGFRPGNAPRDILEKNFAKIAHDQVLKELIPETYEEAIKKESIDAIALPDISEVKLDRGTLSYKAAVEISPQIKLGNYKGIEVNYKKIDVTPDELKRNLDSLKESRKIENLDDNFAKGLGYPNLAELEKAIERQIFLQKENQQRQKIENEVIETITKDLDFKIPQSLVNRQLQELIRRTKVDLVMKGFPREKIDEQEKEMAKNLEPEARTQVRIYLVLSEVAKKENIPLDDHMPRKVIEFLFSQAQWKEIS